MKQIRALNSSMAFQPPSARQEHNSRKILEELQLKKQLLLKQGVAPTLSSPTINSSLGLGGINSTGNAESAMVSSTQRLALQHAHTQSFGFFVTQDSLFGNIILPVLPRFDHK